MRNFGVDQLECAGPLNEPAVNVASVHPPVRRHAFIAQASPAARARLDLGSAFLFLPADLAEDRPETAAELTLDATWRPGPRWSLGFDSRYDVATGEASRAGLSVGWRNECVDVDVSVARRYTAGGSLEPSTSVGLSVSLEGFSAGDDAVAPGACG